MKLRFWIGCLCMGLALMGFVSSAQAELRINLTEGTFKPVPIAITPFGGVDPSLAPIAQEMTKVIVNDLQSCGLFKLVDPAAYIQSAEDVMTHPRFGDWRLLKAEALVGGLLSRQGDKVRADFRLFDIFTESQLEGLSFEADAGDWRQVAHKIANAVYERITGDPGYFDSRVVYISESGSEINRNYRLAVMDQDGYNHIYLTSGGNMVLTPRFSPDGTKIAYLDYGARNKSPNLKVHDLQTGQSTQLGTPHGMKITPRFTHDGSAVLFSIAERGVTSLYRMDVGSGNMQKLTSSAGSIDVSPCESPDGSQIVYCSDRSGTPQLYVKGTGEGEGTRISFGKGRYFNPVWSPRGDLICFTRQNGQTFYIGVMAPDGSGERMLDTAYLVEGPSWSPNGREVAYTHQASARSPVKLRVSDIMGANKRELSTPGEGSYPSWQGPTGAQKK